METQEKNQAKTKEEMLVAKIVSYLCKVITNAAKSFMKKKINREKRILDWPEKELLFGNLSVNEEPFYFDLTNMGFNEDYLNVEDKIAKELSKDTYILGIPIYISDDNLKKRLKRLNRKEEMYLFRRIILEQKPKEIAKYYKVNRNVIYQIKKRIKEKLLRNMK